MFKTSRTTQYFSLNARSELKTRIRVRFNQTKACHFSCYKPRSNKEI